MNIKEYITDELYTNIGIYKDDVIEINPMVGLSIKFKINKTTLVLRLSQYDGNNTCSCSNEQTHFGIHGADYFRITNKDKKLFYESIRSNMSLIRNYPEFKQEEV